jgi:hypothetical protein
MEWSDILDDASSKLNSLGIRHVVVGSCASMVYGKPRFTRDVDLVVDLQPQHILPLLAAFPPPDHYVSQMAIEQALRQQSMFNIIYTRWAIKVDVMMYDQTSRALQEIERGIEIEYAPGKTVRFAAPEDVILKKRSTISRVVPKNTCATLPACSKSHAARSIANISPVGLKDSARKTFGN